MRTEKSEAVAKKKNAVDEKDDGTARQLVFYLMNLKPEWDSIPADFPAHSIMTENNESMGLLVCVCVHQKSLSSTW